MSKQVENNSGEPICSKGCETAVFIDWVSKYPEGCWVIHAGDIFLPDGGYCPDCGAPLYPKGISGLPDSTLFIRAERDRMAKRGPR